MGMTMTQKILAAHAGLDHVEAGQLIEADLDLVLGNDITSPVAIHEMDKMTVDTVFNKDKIALVMDQEVEGQPSYISAPEYQVLDNANHPDAKLGKDGNRQSASLYDMIPAKPQNSKPFGEWNKGKIMCYKGTVVHYQNDEPVVEYHLWTQQWKEMLDNSKFSKDKWPLAYELLLNCGGENKEGFIGFQDHGDDVWYRNITIKELD